MRLVREVHLTDDLLEARIGAERVPPVSCLQPSQAWNTLIVSHLQPVNSPIAVAEVGVIKSQSGGGAVLPLQQCQIGGQLLLPPQAIERNPTSAFVGMFQAFDLICTSPTQSKTG